MKTVVRSKSLHEKSARLREESRRLIAVSRDLFHDAANLLLQGQLRRLRRKRAAEVHSVPARRAA